MCEPSTVSQPKQAVLRSSSAWTGCTCGTSSRAAPAGGGPVGLQDAMLGSCHVATSFCILADQSILACTPLSASGAHGPASPCNQRACTSCSRSRSGASPQPSSAASGSNWPARRRSPPPRSALISSSLWPAPSLADSRCRWGIGRITADRRAIRRGPRWRCGCGWRGRACRGCAGRGSRRCARRCA